MQIVPNGDNLHAMSKPFEKNKKNSINLSSAELAQSVVKVKYPEQLGVSMISKGEYRNISEAGVGANSIKLPYLFYVT